MSTNGEGFQMAARASHDVAQPLVAAAPRLLSALLACLTNVRELANTADARGSVRSRDRKGSGFLVIRVRPCSSVANNFLFTPPSNAGPEHDHRCWNYFFN